jgi:hypothetical protein
MYLFLNFKENGGWTEWSMTLKCSYVISQNGWFVTYNRNCTNPVPKYGGANCNGPSQNFTSCLAREKQKNLIFMIE